ncbi:MAG: hypothetical protein MI784_02220 [Cytophagales bacterium]|nr:hypothetical protein [Cytophagales bacterium]
MIFEWILIVLLVLIGTGLIVAEVIFIPGTTIVGILGLTFSILGIVFAYSSLGSAAGTAILIGSIVVNFSMLIYALRSDVWSRFSLKTKNKARVNEVSGDNLYVGMEGECVSDLKPIGNAEFGQQKIQVRSLGSFVDAGTRVKIIRIESNKVIVEPLT